jgi:hypothetical protein
MGVVARVAESGPIDVRGARDSYLAVAVSSVCVVHTSVTSQRDQHYKAQNNATPKNETHNSGS